LPAPQFAGDIDVGSIAIESNMVAFARGRRLTGKISPVSLPLPARSVAEIRDPDCTALLSGLASAAVFRAAPLALLPHSTRVVHDETVCSGPSETLTSGNARLSGTNPDWTIIIAENHG
jgi:hypothetical protein